MTRIFFWILYVANWRIFCQGEGFEPQITTDFTPVLMLKNKPMLKSQTTKKAQITSKSLWEMIKNNQAI